MKTLYYPTLVAILLASTVAYAKDEAPAKPVSHTSLVEAAKAGKPYIDARYRYEFVDQENLDKDAHASTLRTKLGYKSGQFYNTDLLLELENISVIGNDLYNDNFNGKTNRPIVSDTDYTLLNQLALSNSSIPDTTFSAGRQIVALGNQRFIGSSSWRQNDQTFDAVTLTNTSLPQTKLFYAYAQRVNRALGTKSINGAWKGHVHMLNVGYDAKAFGTVTGYGYWFDFNEFARANSLQTYGLRYDLKYPFNKDLAAVLGADIAHQKDFGNNRNQVSQNYTLVEPGINYGNFQTKLGYERLGGDGVTAFQTPLGSSHSFAGWSDVITTTPLNGLQDYYATLSYKFTEPSWIKDLQPVLAYHQFNSTEGSDDYGNEWDASLSKPFGEHYTLTIKAADYNAATLGVDTTKFWVIGQVKF